MLRARRRTMWKRVRGLGLVIGLGAILVLAAGVASADKPDKPGKPPKPEPPVDTGIIYCRLDSDVYSMSPDGSGKTSLYSAPSESPEPSNLSHGGRWFLEVRATNGEDASGIPGDIRFNDLDVSGAWNEGEEIWVDANSNDEYDSGETQVYDGGDGWDTIVGTTGIQGNLLLQDRDASGGWSLGEAVWAEGVADGVYRSADDTLIVGVPRGIYPPLDPADPHGPERPRHELFAVSESGTTEVQLTDDISLEPIYWGDSECPRWAPGDTKVSWLARRWDLTSGQLVPDGAGIYTLEVSFSNGQPSPVGEPCLLRCSLPSQDDTNMGPHPAVAGYDWSPDGTAIVYAEYYSGWESQGLHVIDVDSGSTLLMLTSEGISPRWSPDGSKIAFHHEKGIDTIDAAGGNRVNIVSVRGFKKNTILEGEFAFAPHWSPSGSHLVYRYENRKTSWMWTVDICRVAADGTDDANLTKDTEAAAAAQVIERADHIIAQLGG